MNWEEAVLWLRDQPNAHELVRACFYDDPLHDAAERYRCSSEWAAIRKLVPQKKGDALDVGAGRGIASFALAKDGWRVTALEPDSSRVVGAGAIAELAELTSMPITIVETWGEDLPFPEASFDLVHCRQVLHHARDLSQLCRQIARVLRPGGIMIASREHVLSRRNDLDSFLQSHPLHRLYGGENAYLLSEYTGAVRAAGITLDRVLNPLASDINLYPQTREDIKRRWTGKLKVPAATPIPNMLLTWVGALSNAPGRLYTFVGHKSRE